ncbi:probable serine/threonine-protein kinase DDB_G0267686 isoform X2 [Octopus bimaculoides]|uniref:Uncharacterized protein n=1 Tax=Octopus bimaculoides TaxID=37653 RepID=A0A0L8FRV8_OCTBM|nr:probable serine/threonine-protein kinase DDB_G0267686 isoform X2 [Octopus bimaculoides]|eukprot:XP_014787524.1 PREDICTED: probable serine/threonine-protein kinase DDB_G0267686 isoform X2 [Octopus bimaculoides]
MNTSRSMAQGNSNQSNAKNHTSTTPTDTPTAPTTTATNNNNNNNNNNTNNSSGSSNNNNNNNTINNYNNNNNNNDRPHFYLLRQQKRVTLSLDTIERNLSSFKIKWFPYNRSISRDELLYWTEVLCNSSPLKTSLIPNEFMLQIENRSTWRKLPVPVNNELRRIFTRAKLFDRLITRSINDLQKIYKDYLNKHCLSFLQEGDPTGLKVPISYEKNIQKWRQEIQNEYTILQCQLTELQDLGVSLLNYVTTIDRVSQVMSEVLDFLPHIIELIKLWLIEEEIYLKKVEDELSSLLRNKNRCNKALRQQHLVVKEVRGNYQQQKFISQRLWQDVKATLQEKKVLEQQENILKNNLNVTESELSLKKSTRADAEVQFQTHQNTSPMFFDHWTDFIEKQELDICQLRLRRDRVKVEWSRLIKSKYYCQRKLDDVDSKYQSCKKVLDQMESKLQKEEDDYLKLERDLDSLIAKVDVLERIREQKIQTHTIETIFMKPKALESESNSDTTFDKASSLVASEIGKDWICLYKILPFRPTRDIRSRMRDIEILLLLQ